MTEKVQVIADMLRFQATSTDLMISNLYIIRSVVRDFFDENVDIDSKEFIDKLNSANEKLDFLREQSEEFLMEVEHKLFEE